jgi:dimethylargininase
MIGQAPPAEDCPDSVFIEDTVVICEDLAVLTRPGAPARRAEVAGVARAVASLGLRTARIEDPGTLDGAMCCRRGPRCTPGAAHGPTARASASCARCWPRWAAPSSPCRWTAILLAGGGLGRPLMPM